jgi:hypothetical protein
LVRLVQAPLQHVFTVFGNIPVLDVGILPGFSRPLEKHVRIKLLGWSDFSNRMQLRQETVSTVVAVFEEFKTSMGMIFSYTKQA